MYGANFTLYGANSSATVVGHEQENHMSAVCPYRCGLSRSIRRSSLSCPGGGNFDTRRGAFRRAGTASAGANRKGEKAHTRATSKVDLVKRISEVVFIVGVALVVLTVLTPLPAYADTKGSEATAASVPFSKLVEAGDRARRAHQYAEAIRLYHLALDIQPDPAVEGRLGLVFLETHHYALAAENLLQAITKAQAPAGLMQQFHSGFARVRPKVCFVEVLVSEQNTEIFIDGEQEPDSRSSGFHVFVTAGAHTFLAKRAGFQDATATIDAPAGGELQVNLDLKPLPPSPSVQVAPTSNWGPDPSLTDKPVNVGKPANRLSDSYLHFYLGVGPVLVLGATPGVAIGPQTIFGFRRGFFSLNLDARVAWATGRLERAADLQLMTWAFALRPCAHHKFLLGCGVVQVDGLQGLSGNFSSQATFGAGVRGGVEFVLRKPLRLQLWGEGLVHDKGHEVVRDGAVVWQGWPVTGALGVTTLLTW